MVALHFLKRSGRDVKCLYFHHGTRHADVALDFLKGIVGPSLIFRFIQGHLPKGRSQEDFWREQRYCFFDDYTDRKVVTCHHLDDQIETFLQGVSHGMLNRTIPRERDHYLRPFLLVPRAVIEDYARRHDIKYVNDPSNMDNKYTRNRIRNQVIPELLKVNPGFYKSMENLFSSFQG